MFPKDWTGVVPASGGTLLRHLLNTIEMHFPNKVKFLNTLFCVTCYKQHDIKDKEKK